AFVGSEGFLEVADGFDLRGPEIALRHLIRSGKIGKAVVKICRRIRRGAGFSTRGACAPQILDQSFWSMEGEDVATLRRRIELVGELRFYASAFVSERQWFAPFRVNVEQTLAVLAGLFLDTSECE